MTGGALPASERVVVYGGYATAAGVSAGTDPVLRLAARMAGDEVVEAVEVVEAAEAVRLVVEYGPRPASRRPARPGPSGKPHDSVTLRQRAVILR
ncbi:hypothetical protein GCM10010420_27210 [Streptomyces glaucosporus]|uniref:Uncharacterized protein n=1 Tax=Streptomyces glaucosporus TaxID=284044 RepID=A0ABN3IBR5_9ACTN